MKKNMGSTDRILRIVVAAFFAFLYITGKVSGTTSIILLVLGGIFLITAVISICPLYIPFGIKTCKKKD